MDIKETLLNLPAAKLKKAVAIKERIEALQSELENLLIATAPSAMQPTMRKVVDGRRNMSAAARKRIGDAARARWAKVRAQKGGNNR